MKRLLLISFLLGSVCNVYSQDTLNIAHPFRKNAWYVEVAGRAYISLNYERGWNKNRAGISVGFNDFETNLSEKEMINEDVGDHDAFPYLLCNVQYSRLFGKKHSFLELGAGGNFVLFDLTHQGIANNLYENESNVYLYPIIGYRYEGSKGLLFLFTFNPLIQLPEGEIWPIPGISVGYKF